jgi:hypothetical protein
MNGMHDAFNCRHHLQPVGDLSVMVCTTCQTTQWWDGRGLIYPADGVARLFGEYELIGTLPAVGGPTSVILTYRAPNGSARQHLAAFPVNTWIRIDNGLWLSHDGTTLLLAPADRHVASNFAG